MSILHCASKLISQKLKLIDNLQSQHVSQNKAKLGAQWEPKKTHPLHHGA